MNHLYSCNVYLFLSLAILSPSINGEEKLTFGSEPRVEKEVKKAFWVQRNFNARDLAIKIKNKIESQLLTKSLKKPLREMSDLFLRTLLHHDQFIDKTPLKGKKVEDLAYYYKNIHRDYQSYKKEPYKKGEKLYFDLIGMLKSFPSFFENEKTPFLFPSYIDSLYLSSNQIQEMVFRDYYLDTPSYDLHENHALYRLRHRWSDIRKYTLHKYLPFLSFFHPNRFEIQSKKYFKISKEEDVVESYETRLEFGNNKLGRVEKVHPSPWPIEKYISTSKDGKLNELHITPYKQIQKYIQTSPLKPVLKLVTKRYRFHLRVPKQDNLWGTGPNPGQVFLVSIDHSFAECLLNLSCEVNGPDNSLLEIEIELERNTKSYIDRILNGDEVIDESLENYVKESTHKANDLLHRDLETLKNIVVRVLSDENLLKDKLETSSKFNRFLEVYRPFNKND